MSTWVLILTLLAPSTTGGVAVTHVPGFQSEAQCNAAATAWISEMNARTRTAAVAVCVRQGGGQ